MRNDRSALWLLLASQLLFLVSSLLDPPSSPLQITLRVVVPLLIVAYLVLVLAGYVRKR
jgi:hypothetical protein